MKFITFVDYLKLGKVRLIISHKLKNNKKILICPLNWGLGHAARCVPIINMLINEGAEVIIASENNPLAFLKLEFPQLRFIEFKGYDINYGNKKNIALKMVLSIPKILYGIYKEHKKLDKIIKVNNIDIVISDNRFGCWNKKIKSIYITHQVMIKSTKYLKFIEPVLHNIHKYFINKFDECWIPDINEGISLSGDLSHKYTLPIPYYYIGILSRFTSDESNLASANLNYLYDLMIIVSGPEPQRSIFEDLILSQLKDTDLRVVIVRGKPDSDEEVSHLNKNVIIYSHLNTNKFKDILIRSAKVICRSGYSTLMDLAVFGKQAILVPTSGQTEQEYLANYHYHQKHYYYMLQKDFNINNAIINSEGYNGLRIAIDTSLLKERTQRMLKR